MTNSDLKNLSKKQLQGRWKFAVLYVLVLLACIFLFEAIGVGLVIIPFLPPLIMLLVSSYSAMSNAKFALKGVQSNNKFVAQDVLPEWKFVWTYTKIMFVLGLLLIPIMLVWVISFLLGSLLTFGLFGIVLLILSIIAIVIFNLYTTMLPFIVLNDVTIGPIQSLKEAYRLLKGNLGRCFCLYFYFWVLILGSVILFCIPILWILPYMNFTFANFYMELITERPGKERKEFNPEVDAPWTVSNTVDVEQEQNININTENIDAVSKDVEAENIDTVPKDVEAENINTVVDKNKDI